MSWLENRDLPDGRIFRRLVELPLVRARNPMLGLAWTLVHVIEDGIRRCSPRSRGDERFR